MGLVLGVDWIGRRDGDGVGRGMVIGAMFCWCGKESR
jgi:hypothetical protein